MAVAAKKLFLLLLSSQIVISSAKTNLNDTKSVLKVVKGLLDFTKDNYEENAKKAFVIFKGIYMTFAQRTQSMRKTRIKFYEDLEKYEKDFLVNEARFMVGSMLEYVSLGEAQTDPAKSTCSMFSEVHKLFCTQELVYNYCFKTFIDFPFAESAVQAIAKETDDETLAKLFRDFRSTHENHFDDYAAANNLLKDFLFKFTDILEFADCLETMPCGTFVPYDIEKDKKAPEKRGFSAGKWFDESEVYIGSGYNKNPKTKALDHEIIGRLDIASASPGIYLENFDEVFSNESLFYLLNHKHLKWVNHTWKEDAEFPKNTVSPVKSLGREGIGRFNMSIFSNVGHVMKHFGFFFTSGGESFNATEFELLVCDDRE